MPVKNKNRPTSNDDGEIVSLSEKEAAVIKAAINIESGSASAESFPPDITADKLDISTVDELKDWLAERMCIFKVLIMNRVNGGIVEEATCYYDQNYYDINYDATEVSGPIITGYHLHHSVTALHSAIEFEDLTGGTWTFSKDTDGKWMFAMISKTEGE